MSTRDKQQYYSQIRSIRQKIQMQRTPQIDPPSSQRGVLQDFKQNQKLLIQDKSIRPFSSAAQASSSKINARVKELECVYGKIQNVLAKKRPSVPKQNQEYSYKKQISKRKTLFALDDRVTVSKITESPSRTMNHQFNRYTSISDHSNERKIDRFCPQIKASTYFDTSKQIDFSENDFAKNEFVAPLPSSPQKSTSHKENLFKSFGQKETVAKSAQQIANILSFQVNLDLNLRKLRQEFNSYRSQDKWSKLYASSNRNGIYLTQDQLKKQVSISQQQFDPFRQFTQQNTFPYGQLIDALAQSNKHWQQKLKGCTDRQSLKQNGLFQRIAKSLVLQDLVCLLNFKANTFYRNRDVFTVFSRLKKIQGSQTQTIELETLTEFLTK